MVEIPCDSNVIAGPTKTRTTAPTSKSVNNGWKIDRKTNGKCFFNQLPTGLASQAAKIIGKIE